MARFVKVTTIGSPLLDIGDANSGFALIESMVRKHWENQFDQVLADSPDLIVVNELCDTPKNLAYKTQMAFHGEMGESLLEFFTEKARNNNCCIAYSGLRLDSSGNARNSTRFIDRNGKVAAIYDKNYPTFEEIGHYGIKPGNEITVYESDFGRVGMLICFDLNFEDIRARYSAAKPDILIFSSMYHGGLMQNYWAYSCRSYFAGAVSGLQCTVLSPVGETIAKSTNYYNYASARINLDYKLAHLDMNWEPIRQARKKYGEGFKLSDPGYLGAVMLSSEFEGVQIDDIVKDVGIELLDDYFSRYESFRKECLNPHKTCR